MAMLLAVPERGKSSLAQRLLALDPGLDLRTVSEPGKLHEIEFAVLWNHPAGLLATLPKLKGIQSFGAGVDHLLADPDLPARLPVARIVDPGLARSLSEFVLAVVLVARRRLDDYAKQQFQRRWQVLPEGGLCVGILGLGELGRSIAQAFYQLGYEVSGWARSAHQIEGVQCLHGERGLSALLAEADFIIATLPLTPATRGLLNSERLAACKPGACLVNVGRGALIDQDALLKVLDSGPLGSACLDVFETEPLPPEHPFWQHPRIRLTPHVAALTDPDLAARQALENYRRAMAGKTMKHLVDLSAGY